MLRNLLNPDNPFVPWLLLMDLVAVLVHIAIVYWVYRDALWRYNRGAPWALLAAVFPIGGWLFYLLYRSSPLVELDRIEAETFDEGQSTWTDYDRYRADQTKKLFQDISSWWKKAEASGYSPWVQRSRARETGELTAEQKQQRREDTRQRRLQLKKEKALKRAAVKESKIKKQQERKERQTVIGAHGAIYRLSDRRQRKLQKQLSLLQKLKSLPREDAHLEQLIYEMNYDKALTAAKDGLAIAEEMSDQQAKVTFEGYIERLNKLINERS